MRNAVGPVAVDRSTGAEVRLRPTLTCLVRALNVWTRLDRLAPPTITRRLAPPIITRRSDVVDHVLRFARATVIREVGP